MNANKGIRGMAKLALAAFIMLLWGNAVHAGSSGLPEGKGQKADGTEFVLVSMTEAAKGYERADTGSGIAAELQKGQKLLLVVEADDTWCQVLYQQKEMYVQKKYLQAVTDEAAAQEIQELEAVRASQAQQDVLARKEAMRGRIWGIVIGVIIAGIFIAGIIAALRSGDKEEANMGQVKKGGTWQG